MMTTAEQARAPERGRPFHTNVLLLLLFLLRPDAVHGQLLSDGDDRLFVLMNNAASLTKNVAVSSSSKQSRLDNLPSPPEPSSPPRPPIPANWVNLALGQPVYASSSFLSTICPNLDCGPKYVVDGNTTSAGVVYQSDFGDVSPWVSIDLGAPAAVHHVVLHARNGFLIPQQSGLEVRVGNTSITNTEDTSLLSRNPIVWRQSGATTDGAVMDIYLDSPVVGRWVTTQSSIPFMALVEVQVFGVSEEDPLAPKPSSAPSPPAAAPANISDPPVSGIAAQCGYAGRISHMNDNGICVDVTFSCPYIWAYGNVLVNYRFIYQKADGSRSSGTTALKMTCMDRMYAVPQLYVEFASPFSLGPGDYLVLQQKNFTASCKSKPWWKSWEVQWEDVLLIAFTTPRTFMYLFDGIPLGPSVNWTSQNCSLAPPPPWDYSSYYNYYYSTPPSSDPSDNGNNQPYDLRLTGGSWAGEGVLEVFDGLNWGTICAEQFTDLEAAIACRDLGYPTGAVVTPNPWDSVTSSIILDRVDCRFRINNSVGLPSETFSQCFRGVLGMPYCTSNKRVAIRCYGNDGPTQPPLPPSPPPPRPPTPHSWINLALNKPAYASSALRGLDSVDGRCGTICGPTLVTDGNLARSSQYQSASYDDYQPWLSIDLGAPATVHQIVIHGNLLLQLADRVEIYVGNVSITQTRTFAEAEALLYQNQLVWSQAPLTKPFYSRKLQSFVEPPVVGRWVTVHKVVSLGLVAPTMVVEEVQVLGLPSVPPAPVKRFQLRLVGGRAPNSGRVEMFSGSKWGTICDRTFDNAAATVTCRELGYKSGVAMPGWGAGSGPILMADVRCDPSVHMRLSQCQAYGNESAYACQHRQDVGVMCKDTLVTSESPFTPVSISAGGFHTCATSRDGRVKCFGQNDYGQLGLSDYLTRGDRPEHMGALLPTVKLGPRFTVSAIAGGMFHTCAILQPGGVVKCWGRNTNGQLGLGDSQNRGDDINEMGSDLPTVDLGPGLVATAITAGDYHTCAILQPGGIVKCWGVNYRGELGLGDFEWRGDEPGEMGTALPAVDLGPGLVATAIDAGADHTCVVLQPGGIVKCWGYNLDATLGLGDMIDRGIQPGQMGANLPAVDLGRGFKATAVACGSRNSCAMDQSSGLVKCWGDNFYGQLGQGNILRRGDQPGEMGRLLKPISLGEGYRPTGIVAGDLHICALLQPGGVVKCWGSNRYGATGLEVGQAFGDQPREMGDFLKPVNLGVGLNASAITAGYAHTCALLQPGNIVKCWGVNSRPFAGTLGLGDSNTRGLAKNTMGDKLPPVQL
ncbi:hypothetical protein VaNZ11_016943 [Volvox africanus]|uniref:SRCR domain-containing protein n=1 Tax=Volvox africanus TaxID=51714 RepID=A0ABQ5SPT1_9CHLO|nr:hypothetical protein VaNZ11_016943 [Volvox africanus]